MRQLTEKQAILFHESGIWKDWTHEQIVRLQIFQNRLCVPFNKYHEAIESVLGRPVYTHEFAYNDALVLEYLGEKPSPSFDEIMSLIPQDKQIYFIHP